MILEQNSCTELSLWQRNKSCKDQESIQSSTTPDPSTWESDKTQYSLLLKRSSFFRLLREEERKKDRQTDRQTDRERERQRDRDRERNRLDLCYAYNDVRQTAKFSYC